MNSVCFKMPALSKIQVDEFIQSDGFGIMSFARVICDEEAAFSFCRHTRNLNLDDPPHCEMCANVMTLVPLQGKQCRFMWDCGRPCRHRVNVSSHTILDGVRTSYLKTLEILVHWFCQVPVTTAAGQLGASKKTAIYWYRTCREICEKIILDGDIAIGEPNLIVEIDETHLCRRKYNRGRVLATQDVWVFGGICRDTKEGFMQEVPNRTGNTLWPIIRARIQPGTFIMHDDARVYKNLHWPQRGGYSHGIVNHSGKIFVNPKNRVIHTNTIERRWGLVKGKVRGFIGDQNLDMFLGEFLYREKHFKTPTDRQRRQRGPQFQQFLSDVSQVFPGYKNEL